MNVQHEISPLRFTRSSVAAVLRSTRYDDVQLLDD